MRKISFFILALLPVFLHAQFSETLSTDRPGQALGVNTVGKKTIQIQTGINSNFMHDDLENKYSTILSNTVIRIGLFERLELNGLINWQNDQMNINGESGSTSGISDTELGARWNILENRGAIPSLGLQGSLLLKAQSPEYARDKMGSRIVLATGNKINNWLSINTNLGVGWNGNGDAQSIYVLNFSMGITDKLGAIAEVYGSFNEFDANFDAGIGYLLTNNLQIDLSAGWQGDNQMNDWFIDAGVSWRLNWRKETE